MGAGYGHEHTYGSYRMAHGTGASGGPGMGGGEGMATRGGGGGMSAGIMAPSGSGMGMGTGMGKNVDDAFAMWSEAPAGFELNEWGDYLSNLNDATSYHHGHRHGQHGQFHGPGGG